MSITVESFKKSNVCMRATLLDGVETTSNGEWVKAEGFSRFSVHVDIETTATVQIMVSNAPAPANADDGPLAVTQYTASGFLVIEGPARWIKAKITAHTSGAVSAYLEAQP